MEGRERNEGIIVSGGSLSGDQIVVGRNARARMVKTEIASGEKQKVDPESLRAALKELRLALGQAGLPEDTVIATQTAVGSALIEGVSGDEVKGDVVAAHLQRAGKVLKEAKVAVDQGSSLAESVAKLVPLLAPLVVGGGRVVAAWFGL